MANGDRRPNLIERAIGPTIERAVVSGMRGRLDAIAAEMIGRYVLPGGSSNLWKQRATPVSFDETRPDYEGWDKLRRCKAGGYSLGALFAQRIERVFAAWVFGSGLQVTLLEDAEAPYDQDARDYTNARLAEFVSSLLDAGASDSEELSDRDDQNGALLPRLYRDARGLGDQWIIVNADGSLSVPSPDTVEATRDPLDYRVITAVTVTTKTADGHTITDEYTPTGRTVTVKKGTAVESVEHYANLLGIIPVVHVAHNRSGNETNGHSMHEELLPLYSEYDDLVYKQLAGAKLLGNPIPTFTGLKDPATTIAAMAPIESDSYTDKDGNTATREVIRLDQEPCVALGEGADFKMVAPPIGFTEDAKNALKSLFLLLLDHTGIPEFVWGGEMGQARASSNDQLTSWVHELEGEQRDQAGWIVRLCRLWLAYRSLVDPRLIVGRLRLTWAPLVQEDEALKLQKLAFAADHALLTATKQLRELDLDTVDDPEAEVEAAQAEAEERREAMFPDGPPELFGRQLQAEGRAAQRGEEGE